MGVTVVFRMRMAVEMHVPRPVMVVLVQVPPFAKQFHAKQAAERHQHQSHNPLGCDRERFGNGNAEHKDNGADHEQHKRMADAPAQTDQPGCTPRRPLGEHGRDSGKMVRVQCMSKSEEKAESENGQIGEVLERMKHG